MALDQDIRDRLAATLGEGVVVDAVTVTPAGKRRVVRVTIERAVTDAVGDTPIDPLTLDEIGDATRLVSDALDDSDVMGEQPYTLEVSTPGTDRPLTEPVDFRRNVDRLVALSLRGSGAKDPHTSGTAEGERTGRIMATTADGVELHIAGTKKKAPHREHIPFTDITKGVARVEFNRPQSPSETTDGDTEA